MILQKNGKATPSVAASLIERLPDDPQRSEEMIAKNVVFIAYAGTWCTLANDLGRSADFFIAPAGPVSAGADTVSKRSDDIISLIA